MNTPNKLTFTRIILAFICIGFILWDTVSSISIAFAVFILASVTDYLDGFLARKHSNISDLGKILDPIADKILIIGTFLSFLQLGVINVWLVVAIMVREFILTSVRLYGLSKGIVMEAKSFGKHKTLSQVLAIVFIFIVLIVFKLHPQGPGINFFYYKVIPLVMWYVVIITLFSGIHYFWVNRKSIITF